MYSLSNESICLLKRLLEINPEIRITASEALEHDFFNSGQMIEKR